MKIKYNGEDVEVKPLDRSRRKIATDDNGDFYILDRTRSYWKKISHGLFCLYRYLTHIILTHKLEVITLERLDVVKQGLNLQIVDLREATMNFGAANKVQGVVSYMLALLGQVENEHKQRARTQMVWMLWVRDKEGRVNPSMLLCRNENVARELKKRLGQIQDMTPWIMYYREVVKQHILNMEKVLAELYGCYRSLQRCFSQRNASPINLDQLTQMLVQVRKLIPELNLKPYTHLQQHLQREVGELQQAVDDQQWGNVAQLIHRSMMGIVIMRQRVVLELAQRHVSEAVYTHEDMLPALKQTIIRNLRRSFNELHVLDDSCLERPVVGDVCEVLEEVIGLMEQDCVDWEDVKRALDAAVKPI